MKVLKNNFNLFNLTTSTSNSIKPYPRKIICDRCGSELEYEHSDVVIGALGGAYVYCPLCNYDNMIDSHEDEVTLTKDNVEFPKHFHYTSVNTGAVDNCDNEHITKAINNAIDYFRQNKDEFIWLTETGNLHLTVFRYEEDNDYYVVVTDNYYSTYIPFEDKDIDHGLKVGLQ